VIKVEDGEFYTEGEEIDLPASFEYLDTFQGSYVYGQKRGQWGRLLTWHNNFQNLGPGWLVEKIDIQRHCCGA